jgi:outer membrane protein OmpA-like peptidoglycan-associated protein
MTRNTKIAIGVGLVLAIGVAGYFIFRKPKTLQKEVLAEAYDNLTFVTNSDVIKPESFPSLDKVAEFLSKNTNFRLDLVGYTDNVGSDEYNQKLSERRANAVKDYLVKKGIAETLLTAVGKGEANPIADNSTAEGKEKNRRVEFITTKIS